MDSYNYKLDKMRDTILKLEQLLDNLTELEDNTCLLQKGYPIQSFISIAEEFKLKVITELEKQKKELNLQEQQILDNCKTKENIS